MALPKSLAKFAGQEVFVKINDREESELSGECTEVNDHGIVVQYESRNREYSQFVPFGAITDLSVSEKAEADEDEGDEDEDEKPAKKEKKEEKEEKPSKKAAKKDEDEDDED